MVLQIKCDLDLIPFLEEKKRLCAFLQNFDSQQTVASAAEQNQSGKCIIGKKPA